MPPVLVSREGREFPAPISILALEKVASAPRQRLKLGATKAQVQAYFGYLQCMEQDIDCDVDIVDAFSVAAELGDQDTLQDMILNVIEADVSILEELKPIAHDHGLDQWWTDFVKSTVRLPIIDINRALRYLEPRMYSFSSRQSGHSINYDPATSEYSIVDREGRVLLSKHVDPEDWCCVIDSYDGFKIFANVVHLKASLDPAAAPPIDKSWPILYRVKTADWLRRDMRTTEVRSMEPLVPYDYASNGFLDLRVIKSNRSAYYIDPLGQLQPDPSMTIYATKVNDSMRYSDDIADIVVKSHLYQDRGRIVYTGPENKVEPDDIESVLGTSGRPLGVTQGYLVSISEQMRTLEVIDDSSDEVRTIELPADWSYDIGSDAARCLVGYGSALVPVAGVGCLVIDIMPQSRNVCPAWLLQDRKMLLTHALDPDANPMAPTHWLSWHY